MEELLFKAIGTSGDIYVYPNKIVIKRKGIYIGLCGKENEIIISKIQGIKFHEGKTLCAGHIKFLLAGDKPNVATDSDINTIMFSKKSNEEMKKVKETVNKLIEKNSAVSNTKIINEISSADELKKFKDLLDSGIITQEEFDQKKKQLLGL